MNLSRLLLGVCFATASLPSVAQNSPPAAPMRISGTIESIEGSVLTVKTPEGSGKITLPPGIRISSNRKASLKDIGPNVFIGTTAVKKGDGKLHATEVHIFPESMRGSGEGHRPWFAADTTMTNGSVTTMTNGSAKQQASVNGEVVLKVAYKGGEQDVLVADDVPITMMEPGDLSMLKPGVQVVSLVRPVNDGTAVALMVSVGGHF